MRRTLLSSAGPTMVLLAGMCLSGAVRAQPGSPDAGTAPEPTAVNGAAPEGPAAGQASPAGPASTAGPAAPATPPCPPCPPGFVCHLGGCVPLPYPVCPPGYWFDGYYCIPRPYAPAPAVTQAEEERANAARLANRMRPKYTLDLQGGVGLLAPERWTSRTTVGAPTGLLLFGYRRNYQSRFGLLFRGGLMLGIPILDYSDSSASSDNDSDATFMTGVLLEAVPYFGPFGRFYFGPAVFLGYVSFRNNDLRAGPLLPSVFHLSDGWIGGAGAAGGFLVGEAERVDINFSLRLDLNPDHHVTLFLMGGVGFLNF